MESDCAHWSTVIYINNSIYYLTSSLPQALRGWYLYPHLKDEETGTQRAYFHNHFLLPDSKGPSLVLKPLAYGRQSSKVPKNIPRARMSVGGVVTASSLSRPRS